MLTRKYQLLLIVIVVLAAFYPANFAGFSSIDDVSMDSDYSRLNGWDLCSLFVPAVGGGLYYRPLLGLSFRSDKLLFGFSPGIMHLENVLLHVLNAILVFFIARCILPPSDRAKSLLPIFASLLFALHPVNAESVNWISGRTDVLAGVFLLSSMVFLLKYREIRQKKYLILSFTLFLGGALTKETSLAFLPGALLVLSATEDSSSGKTMNTEFQQKETKTEQHTHLILAGAVLAIAAFSLLRSIAFTSSASRIGMTFRAMTEDWSHSMFVILRAFGFYLKKLILPYPLNFAIIEVDPLYEVLALPLLMVCIYIITRRTVLSALFAMGILLIMPSFLLAFGQIAWTPYAERYIYLTSAFIVPAAIIWAARTVTFRPLPALKVGSAVIILLLLAATFQRSLVWQDDLKLIEDTVAKAPDYKPLRATYAMELARKREYAAAKLQLKKAEELYSPIYDPRYDFILAHILYKQGETEEALDILERVVEKTKGNSREAIGFLVSLLDERRAECTSMKDVRQIEHSLIRHNRRLYALTGDAHILYGLAISAERLGDQGRAVRLYQQARNNLPDGDPLRKASIKKIEALTHTKGKPHGEKAFFDR